MQRDMQNKKPNSSNWKDRLEDETAFAANELPGTNAAWDKLYSRLHQPSRKKVTWYWVAAACLFIGILFTVIILQPQQQTKMNSIVKAMPLDQREKLLSEVKKNEKPIAVAIENKEAIRSTVKQINKTILQNTIIVPEENKQQPAVSDDNKMIKEQTASLMVKTKQLNDTVAAMQIVSAQPKVKLKVVHVNELGNAADNTYKSRQTGDYGLIQFGIINQQVNNTALAPGTIGLNISTGKNSPSN
jgi:cytochrome c556